MRVVEDAARVSQLAAEIDDERERTGRLDSYRPVLPSGHVVWSTAVSPGSSVVEGQTILRSCGLRAPFRSGGASRTGF